MPWNIYQDPILPWWFKSAVYCLIGGILVVLPAVVIEHRSKTDPWKRMPFQGDPAPGLLHDTAEVANLEITKTLGLVRWHIILCRFTG